jgi:hypothetical protein
MVLLLVTSRSRRQEVASFSPERGEGKHSKPTYEQDIQYYKEDAVCLAMRYLDMA